MVVQAESAACGHIRGGASFCSRPLAAATTGTSTWGLRTSGTEATKRGHSLERCAESYAGPIAASMSPVEPSWTRYIVGTEENKGLASVALAPWPKWELCAGVQALLDLTGTPEERSFLSSYLDEKAAAESEWRRASVGLEQGVEHGRGWLGPNQPPRKARRDDVGNASVSGPHPACLPQLA